MSKITGEVEAIIIPILDDLSFELVDVRCVKGGKDRFLKISIDKEGDIDLNNCTLASRKISGTINQNDPIPEIYYLDVALPGAERPLKKEKDYQNAIEQPVFVFLYTPTEDGKEWLGIPKSVDDDTITMEVKEKSKKKAVGILKNKIAKTHHAVVI